MGEIVDKKRRSKKREEIVPVEKGPVELEAPDEFNEQEKARLLRVKQDIASGRYTDITDEHRKLLFVEWLIEQGKLKS